MLIYIKIIKFVDLINNYYSSSTHDCVSRLKRFRRADCTKSDLINSFINKYLIVRSALAEYKNFLILDFLTNFKNSIGKSHITS